MQKILKKRILRDLKSNAIRYFALFLLIVMVMYLVVSLVGAAETIIQNVDIMANNHHLEDGEFSVFVPLTEKQIKELEDIGIILEKMFYLDYQLKDNSNLRIYKNRKKINRIVIDEGRTANNLQEIVIEKRYSKEHNLYVGSSIEIEDEVFKIVGIGTVPDYDAVLKNMTDTSVNSNHFGLAFIIDEQYIKLKEKGNYSKTEEFVYSYLLNQAMSNDELKEYLCKLDFDKNKISDTYLLDMINESEAEKITLQNGISELVKGSQNLYENLNKLKESNSQLLTTTSLLPDVYSKFKQQVNMYVEGEALATDGASDLTEGLNQLQKKTNKLLVEYFTLDMDNLIKFVTADDNPRIKSSSEDVTINKLAGLLVGLIGMVLFTYVISVFVIHGIEKEISIIGTLYALGAKKKDLIKHYLTLPFIITLIAGICGTLIGFSKYGIGIKMQETYEYFSIPNMNIVYPIYLIIYGVLMPPVMSIIVIYFVINRKLSQPALKMIRKEHKSNSNININFGNISFIKRFQIRQVLREKRASFTVVFGMFISLLLIMLGIDCYIFCQNQSVNNKKDTKYKYMYTYKYPEKQIRDGGEGCYAEVLSKDAYGNSLDITILGIDNNNTYFDVSTVNGKNKVIVASSTAEKFKLKKGDKLILTDKVNDMDYAFTVEGIASHSVGLYVFMDIDSMRELFKKKDDYYNVLLSSKNLNIDPKRLYTVTTKEDISKSSDVFVDLMMSMVKMLIVVSIIIFCVVMYLMMKIMIDRSSLNIELFKIFGYQTGEIRKLYLNANFYIVTVGAAICIPVSKKLIDMIYPYMISNVACGMNLTFSWHLYLGFYIGVILCYLVINQLLVERLKKIVPAEVLKNRD